MTETPPIACSLDADDLTRRLAAIAAIGTESLVRRETDGALTCCASAPTRRRAAGSRRSSPRRPGAAPSST